MVGGGVSKTADSLQASHVRIASQGGGLLVGEEPGDGSDDVAHMLASAVVSGEGSPVLQMADAVLDPDAPRGVGLALAFMHLLVPLGWVLLELAVGGVTTRPPVWAPIPW